MSLNVQEIEGFRAANRKYGSRGLLLLVKANGSKPGNTSIALARREEAVHQRVPRGRLACDFLGTPVVPCARALIRDAMALKPIGSHAIA